VPWGGGVMPSSPVGSAQVVERRQKLGEGRCNIQCV